MKPESLSMWSIPIRHSVGAASVSPWLPSPRLSIRSGPFRSTNWSPSKAPTPAPWSAARRKACGRKPTRHVMANKWRIDWPSGPYGLQHADARQSLEVWPRTASTVESFNTESQDWRPLQPPLKKGRLREVVHVGWKLWNPQFVSILFQGLQTLFDSTNRFKLYPRLHNQHRSSNLWLFLPSYQSSLWDMVEVNHDPRPRPCLQLLGPKLPGSKASSWLLGSK